MCNEVLLICKPMVTYHCKAIKMNIYTFSSDFKYGVASNCEFRMQKIILKVVFLYGITLETDKVSLALRVKRRYKGGGHFYI